MAYDTIVYLLIFGFTALLCKIPLWSVQTWIGVLAVNIVWQGMKLEFCGHATQYTEWTMFNLRFGKHEN